MPVYHTDSEEENPVFHVVEGCPDGVRITDPHLRMGKRGLCKECLALLMRGVPPMPPKRPKKAQK